MATPKKPPIIDPWTPLAHKSTMDKPDKRSPSPFMAHARRLEAYRILKAYDRNAARFFMGDPDVERREYGDPGLLIDVATTAALGDSWQITVEDADRLPPEIDEEGDPDPDLEEERNRLDALIERQEWLREWARRERFDERLLETERNAVNLGDGVYVLGWSARRQRARLRVYDPGFYFPVLTDVDSEFPERVHIAWEFEEGDRRFVRRITWELAPITAADEDMTPAGARLVNGEWLRDYPWNDEPSPETCYMSDGIWQLGQTDTSELDDLSDDNARWQTNEDGDILNRFDLGIDFIPVVHIPNTVAGGEHYGQSILNRIAHIIDDLQGSDTDTAKSAATTALPVLAVSGVRRPAEEEGTQLTYRPGDVFDLGPDGKMDALDTSTALDALLKWVESLKGRLSENSRIPAEILGRVSAGEVASGILMAFSFGPLRGLVREMRLAREVPYQLLFKFVQRFGMLADTEPLEAPPEPAGLVFGSYLPSDLKGVAELVKQLLEAKAISRRTAVMMLIDAGVAIDDAVEEVKRIQGEDLSGARDLADATEDDDTVFDYLGRPPPERPEIDTGTPELDLPPPGGEGG